VANAFAGVTILWVFLHLWKIDPFFISLPKAMAGPAHLQTAFLYFDRITFCDKRLLFLDKPVGFH
jgi:hypothetical protein